VALPARGFGDAEIGGKKCPAKLIGQRGVAAWELACDGVAEAEGLARHIIQLEPGQSSGVNQ
jgi:hypothetical protein